jgi:3,4-dihydroxy 2-butanone 4-phosphate synthase/GTP cyclohydrolase II
VRVHEPVSLIDVLDVGGSAHAYSVPSALRILAEQAANAAGAIVLLHRPESADDLAARALPAGPRRRRASSTCATTAPARRSCAISASAR